MVGHSYLHDEDVDTWRYVCPSCGSHTIEVRQKRGWNAEHTDVNPTPLEPHADSPADFKCNSCGQANSVLYDKKERETVKKFQLDL